MSWVADGLFLANEELSKKVRHVSEPMYRFRQFVRRENAFGKGRGDGFDFDVVGRLSPAGNVNGISELASMPVGSVAKRKKTLTVNEYGNSIDLTGKTLALSQIDIKNVHVTTLRMDMARTIDAAVAAEFKRSMAFYFPTGNVGAPTGSVDITTTTTKPTSTPATRQGQVYDTRTIVDFFRQNSIQPYDGTNYLCIATTPHLRGIMNDPDWRDAKLYGEPEALFRGEVGRIEGVRYIHTSNSDALSNSTTTDGIGEAIYFGVDPVVEGLAMGEEIRAKLPDDYGRDQGMAWYLLAGWRVTWEAGLDPIGNATTNVGEAHIVYFTGQ